MKSRLPSFSQVVKRIYLRRHIKKEQRDLKFKHNEIASQVKDKRVRQKKKTDELRVPNLRAAHPLLILPVDQAEKGESKTCLELLNLTNETHDAKLFWIKRFRDLPTQNKRTLFVKICEKIRFDRGLRSAVDITKSRRKVVKDRDVSNRLVADVFKTKRKLDELARFCGVFVSNFDNAQFRGLRVVFDLINRRGAFDISV